MHVQHIKEKLMVNREEYIRDRMGSANPFRVPDGYFEGFASQLMEKLPEKAPHVVRKGILHSGMLRYAVCAAACFCAVVLGVTAYLAKIERGNSLHSGNLVTQTSVSTNADIYDDVVTDYVMIDNADIYAYISNDMSD